MENIGFSLFYSAKPDVLILEIQKIKTKLKISNETSLAGWLARSLDGWLPDGGLAGWLADWLAG